MKLQTMTSGIFTVIVVAGLILAIIPLRILRARGHDRLVGMLALGLLAAVLFVFYLDDAMVFDRRAEIVREQFHLAEDVEIGRISGGEKIPVCHRNSVFYRATARFTPGQFERYVAAVGDRAIWRPQPPAHYLSHKSRFEFAGDALSWRELPDPGRAGQQGLVWKVAGEDVRRGLALCYDIRKPAQQPGPAPDGVTTYIVSACDARARATTPAGGGHVEAALDLDRRQLNMTLHFDSKPDYCNNRVGRWLAGRLGLEFE